MAGELQEVKGRRGSTAAVFAPAAALVAVAVLVIGGAGPAGARDLLRLQAAATTVPAASVPAGEVPKINAPNATVPGAAATGTTVPSIPVTVPNVTVPSSPAAPNVTPPSIPVTVPNVAVPSSPAAPNVTPPSIPVTAPNVAVPSPPVTFTVPGARLAVPGASGSPSGAAVSTFSGAEPAHSDPVPSSDRRSTMAPDIAGRAPERAREAIAGQRLHPANEALGFRLRRAAAETVQQMTFPLGLMLAMLAFLVFQHRVDKNDPRLVTALESGDEDLLEFS